MRNKLVQARPLQHVSAQLCGALLLAATGGIFATPVAGVELRDVAQNTVPLEQVDADRIAVVGAVLSPGILGATTPLNVSVSYQSTAMTPEPQLQVARTVAPLSDPEQLADFSRRPQAFATVPLTVTTPVSNPVLGTITGPTITVAGAIGPDDLGFTDPGVYGLVVSLRAGDVSLWEEATALTWAPNGIPSLHLAVLSSDPAEANSEYQLGPTNPILDPLQTSAEQISGLAQAGDPFVYLPAGSPDLAILSQVPDLANSVLQRSAKLSQDFLAQIFASESEHQISGTPITRASRLTQTTYDLASQLPEVPLVVPAPELRGLNLSNAVRLTPTGATVFGYEEVLLPQTETGPSFFWQQQFSGQLALMALHAHSNILLLPQHSAHAKAALARISQMGWIQVVDFADIAAAPITEAVAALPVGPTSAAGTDVLSGLDSTLNSLAGIAAAVENPVAFAATYVLPLFRLFSGTPGFGTADWDAEAALALDIANGATTGVSIASGSKVNLISSSGNVPITIRNDLHQPTTVRVVLTTSSPRLRIEGAPIATLPPQSEQVVLVPVKAISNGTIRVSLALTNDAGEVLATAPNLEMRINADWGNAATGVTVVLLVLMMVAGIWRTIRRGKKDTRLDAETAKASLGVIEK